MRVSPFAPLFAGALLLAGAATSHSAPAGVRGWLNWRGPNQNGTSPETGLPDTWELGGKNDLWHIDLRSSGTPAIANGRVFAFGYRGDGPDLREVLVCADAETGKTLWEKYFTDFLSDIVYDRYAIGSPCIDPETGNVFILTSPGIFASFTPDGKELWHHSLMEEIGKLTFTNGRTGGPWVDQDLVYIRGLTSNWGGDGPALDRFYAFDKKSGGLVWSSGPGERPKDNSFAMPVMTWQGGKRLLYSGTGDGNFVCVNARTGQPVWRFPLSAGGMNSSLVHYKNMVVGIHADENLDSSEIGRMTAVKIDVPPVSAEPGTTPILPKSAEAWRNPLEAISSSPVVVGNKIYQVVKTGSLDCVDADTGKVLWKHKLAPDELHASPTYADGKLYVPMHNGMFYIIKPGDSDAQELCKVKLEGNCNSAPAIYNGKVYVFTTSKLYCFGRKGGASVPAWPVEKKPKAGKPVALQVIPAEVLLRPGQHAKFTVRGIDENGFPTGEYRAAEVKWAKYIPPTAKVRAEMNGSFNAQGELVADSKQEDSAGAFEATVGDLKGHIRGRVLPAIPYHEDFESFQLTVPHATESGVKFAYPPLPWIGARFKWEVRDVNGTKALTKTLDNIFFQRSTVFLGHPDDKNYTMEADVMSDGNRRTMSSVGLVNQRYYITLLGNSQELEVSSNQERLKVAVPFPWTPHTWYHLKTRVDVAADGSGVIRAKAWKKGEPEPEKWTAEVPHRHALTNGAAGLFGFAPQSLFRVYVDNISVTPNSSPTAAR